MANFQVCTNLPYHKTVESWKKLDSMTLIQVCILIALPKPLTVAEQINPHK